MLKIGRCIATGLLVALVLPPSALRAQDPLPILVESPTMRTGEKMPRDYSPDGRNASPPLTWRNLPAGTEQIALICQDHGAGNPGPWVHWIMYNVPASAGGVPEGVPIQLGAEMPAEIAGAVQGSNGWSLQNYRGPAPPVGEVHHYHFVVYALDEALDLPPGLDRNALLDAIEGHVIGTGDLIPFYEREPMPGPTSR